MEGIDDIARHISEITGDSGDPVFYERCMGVLEQKKKEQRSLLDKYNNPAFLLKKVEGEVVSSRSYGMKPKELTEIFPFINPKYTKGIFVNREQIVKFQDELESRELRLFGFEPLSFGLLIEATIFAGERKELDYLVEGNSSDSRVMHSNGVIDYMQEQFSWTSRTPAIYTKRDLKLTETPLEINIGEGFNYSSISQCSLEEMDTYVNEKAERGRSYTRRDFEKEILHKIIEELRAEK